MLPWSSGKFILLIPFLTIMICSIYRQFVLDIQITFNFVRSVYIKVNNSQYFVLQPSSPAFSQQASPPKTRNLPKVGDPVS